MPASAAPTSSQQRTGELAMKFDTEEHNNNSNNNKNAVMDKTSMTGSELMRGQLVLLAGQGAEQRMMVKVYRTTLEHFAIVCPNKRLAKPLGCINLRNAAAEPLDNCDRSFRIVPRSCDGITLEFRADSAASRSRWLAALWTQESPVGKTKKKFPSSPLALPVLVEDDEE